MKKQLNKIAKDTNIFLKKYINSQKYSQLMPPMKYGLFPGGKKIRSKILIDLGSLFSIDYKTLIIVGSAVECIHAYSLIHDDLPSMDNDDFRRGKQSNHKKFGEATAILAGDALHDFAFQIISENLKNINSEQNLKLINYLTKCTGLAGLAGGQSLDLLYENKNLSKNKIIEMYNKKTGKLFEFSFAAPFILKNENTLLCGLGCRDSLRVEAGLSLYGNEINEDITPIQANLSWALDKNRLEDDNLNGSSILLSQLQETKKTRKIGITAVNKTMLRNNMTLYNNEQKEIGYITSGCFSPVLKRSIGIGYINNFTNKLDKLFVNVRGDFEEVIIDNIPFVKKNYKKGG